MTDPTIWHLVLYLARSQWLVVASMTAAVMAIYLFRRDVSLTAKVHIASIALSYCLLTFLVTHALLRASFPVGEWTFGVAVLAFVCGDIALIVMVCMQWQRR